VETQLVYEEKGGCWVPKAVLTKMITPGGALSSVVKLENKNIEKY